ncbi:MAG: sigma 54-interacting transcriptional regulator [Peptostreptococcaceae bacterium]
MILNNLQAKYTFENIIGQSTQIRNLIEQSILISKNSSTVLILGESGCGKELLAQSIHNESEFKNGPFVAVNCGAIPEYLIESELFGYEEGSFTGAKKSGYVGKFELANNGTIFLDEIAEMPINMQVTLLRVLQEGYITKIGGKKQIPINVRVVAATNKDLKEEIKNGNFREDLFYRLNVLPLNVPSLKDRIGDIPLLINHFLHIKSQKLNKPIPKITQSLYRKMVSFCWPGNIRELENCIENIVALEGIMTFQIDFDECYCMTHDNLGNKINPFTNEIEHENIELENSIKTLEELEIIEIKKALSLMNNMTEIAKKLGITRSTLYSKIKKYNL